MEYCAPKGMHDVKPNESYKWHFIEDIMRKTVSKYGFLEARTPVVEHTELFLRGVGKTTDIVQKEMYTFNDKGDRSVTLKPEGTAGMVRLFVENKLFSDVQPTKMYYLNSPIFRYEKPQAGRLREHHQFGVEMFGAGKPEADAECILLASEVINKVGISGLSVRLNSIGCPECRPKYQKALHSFLESNYDNLCETCKSRFQTNPLRILDCKVPSCQKLLKNVPVIKDYLCDDCENHFEQLLSILDDNGVRYEISPMLVRGLDYYTKTVFEIYSDKIGSQGAICGGGRYDKLISEIGGPDIPGVGFGMGMERLLLLMEEVGTQIPEPIIYDVFLASTGPDTEKYAFRLSQQLRDLGYSVGSDVVGRSLKAQFKYADKIQAKYVIVIGEDEVSSRCGKIKELSTGNTFETSLEALAISKLISNE